jgi:peptidoglycan/xylan/chitin deacetylase (PgdA/CDA1 family)
MGWVRFPYYHHVFADERTGFARQLDYLARFGEFISIDDAVKLLSSDARIDGRYFCVSFDDGFKSCATNALPILSERHIPAVFYVVTDFAGCSYAGDAPVTRDVFGQRGQRGLEFMSRDDWRTLVAGGMTVGSHTKSHARLALLSADQVRAELDGSKSVIEQEVGRSCRHFCAPYGMVQRDFDPIRDVELCFGLGYASFATGTRGRNHANGGSMVLNRDHLVATWGLHQLRYFMSA